MSGAKFVGLDSDDYVTLPIEPEGDHRAASAFLRVQLVPHLSGGE